MSWPMPQDFNEAIQNPKIAFSDPDLRSGSPVVGAHGMPLPRSGNFADVYQVRGADGQEWAVKCFTRQVTGLGKRYEAISEALADANFPFSVGFEFLAEGIRVGGVWRPVVKMEWVEGLLLNQVIRENAARPPVLLALGQVWAKLSRRLREGGVAHADLQHGNVMLVPGSRPGTFGLKLIDYDGMYVPALANVPSGESGHPAYQHPGRAKNRAYSPDVDRFPHLVIATALRGLAVCGQPLWDKYDNGDNLLFTEEDFRKPSASKVMRELWNTDDGAVQAFVGRLALACGRAIPQTPWLDQFAPEGDPAPLDAGQRREAATALGVALPVPATPPPTAPKPRPNPGPEEPFGGFQQRPSKSGRMVPAVAQDPPSEDGVVAIPSGNYRRKRRSSKLPLLLGGLLLVGGAVAGVVMFGKPKPEVAKTSTEKTDETKGPDPEPVKPKDKDAKEDPKKDPKDTKDPKDPQPREVPVVPLDLLDTPTPKSESSPAVLGWRKKGTELPTVLANTSDKPALVPETKTLMLSPLGVGVHPTAKEFVAVAWKSPIAGRISIQGKVAHLDKSGSNGIAWWLEHRTGEQALILAEGSLDAGRDTLFKADIPKLAKGDQILLVVDAREGNHLNDTTEISLAITELENGKSRRVWNLSADVAETIAENNPHADKHGNKDTWSFVRASVITVPGKPKDPYPITGPLDLRIRWTTPFEGGKSISRVVLSTDPDLVMAIAPSGVFPPLDGKTGLPRKEFAGVGNTGATNVFTLDKGRIATLTTKPLVFQVWDSAGKESGRILAPDIPPGAGAARGLRTVLSPDGRYVAIGRAGLPATDNPEVPIRVYDTTTSQFVVSTTWKGGAMFFTADSSRVLVAEWIGRCRWFKLPSGEPDGEYVLTGMPPGRRHNFYGISADGSAIAYNGPSEAKETGTVACVLDGKSGKPIRQFPKHYRASEVVLSADGQRAILLLEVEDQASTFEIVEVSSGKPQGRVRVTGKTIPTLSLSDDGRIVAVYDPETDKLHLMDVPGSEPPPP